MSNTLYHGDNLRILRDYFGGESLDLLHLDAPFNSNAAYDGSRFSYLCRECR